MINFILKVLLISPIIGLIIFLAITILSVKFSWPVIFVIIGILGLSIVATAIIANSMRWVEMDDNNHYTVE